MVAARLLTRFSGWSSRSSTAPDDRRRGPKILLLSFVDIGAVSCGRRRHRMGYAGDCRILNGSCPTPAVAARSCIAGAMPFDLRRNPFGILPTLRASLPVNLKGHFPASRSVARASRYRSVCAIWHECLAKSGPGRPVRRAQHGGRDDAPL